MNAKGEAVDLIHLNRYTGGDRALNREILGLFESQCGEMLVRLESFVEEAGDPAAWREITHSLKGAARGIGAFALADAAADAEKTGQTDRRALIAAVQCIRDRASSVHLFIEEFLKRNA